MERSRSSWFKFLIVKAFFDPLLFKHETNHCSEKKMLQKRFLTETADICTRHRFHFWSNDLHKQDPMIWTPDYRFEQLLLNTLYSNSANEYLPKKFKII